MIIKKCLLQGFTFLGGGAGDGGVAGEPASCTSIAPLEEGEARGDDVLETELLPAEGALTVGWILGSGEDTHETLETRQGSIACTGGQRTVAAAMDDAYGDGVRTRAHLTGG